MKKRTHVNVALHLVAACLVLTRTRLPVSRHLRSYADDRDSAEKRGS